VHELRVSIRRLASEIALLGRVIPSRQERKAVRLLKQQLESLGALRDLHVLAKFAEGRSNRFPKLKILREELASRNRKLSKATRREVAGFEKSKLQRWIKKMEVQLRAEATATNEPERMASQLSQQTNHAFSEAVARCREINFSDPRTIHRLRVAFKKFRYTVESLPPQLSGMHKRDLQRLALYQRRMGKIQDLEVIQNLVTELAGHDKAVHAALASFDDYLKASRARTLSEFRKSFEKLFEFWPPCKSSS
jgi:CHAD domain-containing protein